MLRKCSPERYICRLRRCLSGDAAAVYLLLCRRERPPVPVPGKKVPLRPHTIILLIANWSNAQNICWAEFLLRSYSHSLVDGDVLFLFCLYLTYGRWASTGKITKPHLLQRYHPACCCHQGSSHLSPVLAYELLSRCKLSTPTPRQPMVGFYLLAFLSQNRIPIFVKNRIHDSTLVIRDVTTTPLERRAR